MIFRISVLTAIVAVLGSEGELFAQQVAPVNRVHQTAPKSVTRDSTKAVGDLVTSIARQYIPNYYEDNSNWGMTSDRWDGLHVQLKGLQLKTKRRKKAVNHGDWHRYRIDLLDPQQSLDIRLENVRGEENGRVYFDAYFSARVHAFGRNSNWVKGVQLYSVSADANASVTLFVSGNVALKLDVVRFPPDVVLDPVITEADVRVVDFELQRVSNLRGELAQQLGKSVRRILEAKITETNQKLVNKINRQIEKKRDRLRLSLHDLLASKWSQFAKYIKRDSQFDAETRANDGD